MSTEKHARLVENALTLKKAWLCAVVLAGEGMRIPRELLAIPHYKFWENNALKRHTKEVESDFTSITSCILQEKRRAQVSVTAKWFAQQYDGWKDTGFGVYELGRIHEIENAIGRLSCRTVMDCPPYAQLLLQGLNLPAIRHPEYHLGSDLALLFNLLLDNEAISDDAQRRRELHCSEHGQSLGRSVILTCFNLLESFVSGLAVAWVMENPGAAGEVAKKLEDKKLSLRRRFVEFPSLISGRAQALDGNAEPVASLFGECKRMRDSFVHCEPGPKPTEWGYVKEVHFHAVDLTAVRKTVDLTFAAISLVWNIIYGRDQPSWLPRRDAFGRFERVAVGLVPLTTDFPVRNSLGRG